MEVGEEENERCNLTCIFSGDNSDGGAGGDANEGSTFSSAFTLPPFPPLPLSLHSGFLHIPPPSSTLPPPPQRSPRS